MLNWWSKTSAASRARTGSEIHACGTSAGYVHSNDEERSYHTSHLISSHLVPVLRRVHITHLNGTGEMC